MRLLQSTSQNPFENLALEDHLLNEDLGEPILLFYRNSPSVIIGKHQNPWLECNLAAMDAAQIPLARRVSGGGAVYHDAGNLNYAFIASLAHYDADANFQFIIDLLATFGVRAQRQGVSNLTVGGKKISGNAFAFRHDNRLHHGTLLLDADLHRLQNFLTPTPSTITTHAIRSEPMPVTNLHLPWQDIINACGTPEEITPPANHTFNTWEWTFGKTPKFQYDGHEIRKGLLNGNPFKLSSEKES